MESDESPPSNEFGNRDDQTPAAQHVVVGHCTAIASSIIYPKMAVANTVSQGLSTTRTPLQIAALRERTHRQLLDIVRDNLHTKYASQASPLAAFRDAVSAHSGPRVDDAALLADFRFHVPLSNYDVYKPFVDKFNAHPCREEDVVDLLAPGLPDFFVMSSATSGTTPKILPKYNHSARLKRPPRPWLHPDSLLAALFCTRNTEVKEIEGVPGQVVHRIPVGIVTGAMLRRAVGWLTDDENQMGLTVSGYAVPWAATVIGHLPSFLIVHGLFFLARRDLMHFAAPFATLFLDLVRYIDQKWNMLVSCIRDGTLPDLEGIDHVREYLQGHFHADPLRAAELLAIGPPFSCEGWVARVWPNARVLTAVCSGPFATVLPKVRSVLGPNIALRTPGYRASESAIGLAHDATKLDEFVLKSDDVVEFLDVSLDETHEQLSQAWDVEVGKQYEPILTTRDGLWRYRLGDVLSIVGFDAESSAPVFKYSGRRSLAIRLAHTLITDNQLLAAVRALDFDSGSGSEVEDALHVQEFTTVVDDRAVPPTVGLFVELAGPLGPNAHLAPQRFFDALVSTNAEHVRALAHGQMRLPTVRVVEAGTFAAYRRNRGDSVGVVAGQIKVPVVLVQPEAQAWISERVVSEL